MDEVRDIEDRISELKKELVAARRRQTPGPVHEYRFETQTEQVTLASLFGDKDDLLLVHNMGAGCTYCTLWADGLNGLMPHIENRTAFVVVSPDPAAAQAKFAAGRGWTFPMVRDADGEFSRDMGFLTGENEYQPGVSAFQRRPDGSIVRTGSTFFGPGDDFCAVWPLFDLLADGDNGWSPKYRYSSSARGPFE